MIACKTTIGFGAPTKAGTSKAHGSPLGADEIAGARKALGWSAEPFEVPVGNARRLARCRPDRRQAARCMGKAHRRGRCRDPRRIRTPHARRPSRGLRHGDRRNTRRNSPADKPKIATRKASEMALEIVNGAVCETLGGSADLTGSNNTKTSQTAPIYAG
jgi:transketolase